MLKESIGKQIQMFDMEFFVNSINEETNVTIEREIDDIEVCVYLNHYFRFIIGDLF